MSSPHPFLSTRSNVIPFKAHQPSPQRLADWGPKRGEQTYAPSFVDMGELSSIACNLTLEWVERNGAPQEAIFPRKVRELLTQWVKDNVRGLVTVSVSSDGYVHFEARDDLAAFTYGITLDPAWLRKDFAS